MGRSDACERTGSVRRDGFWDPERRRGHPARIAEVAEVWFWGVCNRSSMLEDGIPEGDYG